MRDEYCTHGSGEKGIFWVFDKCSARRRLRQMQYYKADRNRMKFTVAFVTRAIRTDLYLILNTPSNRHRLDDETIELYFHGIQRI